MSVEQTRRLKREIARCIRFLSALRHDPRQKWGDVSFYIQATLLHIEEYQAELRERNGMPKQENKRAEWQGFADVKLTSEEKETYKGWDIHDEDLWIIVVDSISSGHKLSVTYNKQNDQFVASFTGQAGTGKNEGFTLSAYAKNWYDAIRVLAFKHSVLLEGVWAAAANRQSDDIG